jgi:hypothetical protein
VHGFERSLVKSHRDYCAGLEQPGRYRYRAAVLIKQRSGVSGKRDYIQYRPSTYLRLSTSPACHSTRFPGHIDARWLICSQSYDTVLVLRTRLLCSGRVRLRLAGLHVIESSTTWPSMAVWPVKWAPGMLC